MFVWTGIGVVGLQLRLLHGHTGIEEQNLTLLRVHVAVYPPTSAAITRSSLNLVIAVGWVKSELATCTGGEVLKY